MKRILTGDRTTGKLHLGHYVGSLKNRVALQNDYDTFILLADIQALTTHFERPTLVGNSIYEVAIDNLSIGLDPEKITLIQQSQIPSIAELTVFYSMFTTVNSLRHNPTIKTEINQYGYKDLMYGFLGYPVSQAADITFCNADLVPVGDDQLPHLEATRKIVRKFNGLYAKESPLITEPQALLSDIPRLKGLDGNSKMGKSLNNAIYLSDDKETVKKKIMSAITDPNRIAKTDTGNPEVCMVYDYQKIFNKDQSDTIKDLCKKGHIGCVACKNELNSCLNLLLDPIRDKRDYYDNNRNLVKEYIVEGSKKANLIGNEMVEKVKDKMAIHI